MNRIQGALAISHHRSRSTNRFPARLAAALALSLLGVLTFASGASADLWSPESGGSPNADSIDSLYWFVMVLAIIVFVGVEGLLFYTLYRYRAGKNPVAKQTRGNNKLEVTWTVAAAFVVVFLAGYTYTKLDEITDPPESIAKGVEPDALQLDQTGRMNVCVDGYQFGWRYIYQREECTNKHNTDATAQRNPGPQDKLYAFEEMVVPVGVTVKIWIGSLDVNHAWWIPRLGGKFDATRGYLIESWFRVPEKFADKPGGTVFFGQCAELCGRNHANMTARVRAVSIQEFNTWARQKRADIALGDATIPKLREKLNVTQSAD